MIATFKFVLQKSREHNKKIGEYINRLSDSTRRITELTEKKEKYSTLAEKIKDRRELAKVRSELVDYNLRRQELTKVRSELNEILYSYTNFNDFDIFLLIDGAIKLFYEMTDVIFFRTTMISPRMVSYNESY